MPNATEARNAIMVDALDHHFGPDADHVCSRNQPCALAAKYLTALGDAPITELDLTEGAVPEHGAGRRPEAGSRASNQYGTFKVHTASDKQMAFAVRLVGERDYPEGSAMVAALDMLALGTIGKRSCSDLIEWLLRQPEKPRPTTASATPTNPPTEKQLGFLNSLLDTRSHPFSDELIETARTNRKAASAMIDELRVMPKAVATGWVTKAGLIAVGMYRTADGTMYRAYFNQDRTRVLAKKLVASDGGWEFEYAGMAHRFVTPEDRMTLEEAKEWGAQYGSCCVCSRLLTDPSSVDAGIGPVCAKNV